MNKYRELVEAIAHGTDDGSVKWQQVRRDANADVIFNANTAFRQFVSSYESDGEKFKLLLVEKKAEDPEFDFVVDRYTPELVVLSEGGDLLVTLSDLYVERSDLIDLVQKAEGKNERLNKLFKRRGA